jgi:hypothetical protein
LVNLIAHSPHDVGEIRRAILDEVERTGMRLPDDIALLALQVPELQSMT